MQRSVYLNTRLNKYLNRCKAITADHMMHKSLALSFFFAIACVLSAPTPVDELIRLLHAADERGGKPGYWTSKVADTIEQCGGAYWDDIMINFNNIRSQCEEMDRMYGMLKRSKLAYCDELFSAPSLTIVKNCETDSFCEKFTRGFSVARGQFEDRSASLLADMIGQTSRVRITSPEEFEEVYVNQGPCKVVFDTLDQPEMDDYKSYFVSLVTQVDFNKEFNDDNKRAADIIGACELMESNAGLLQEAYEIYARQ